MLRWCFFAVSLIKLCYLLFSEFCHGICYFHSFLMGAGLLMSNMYGCCCCSIISKLRIYDPFRIFQFSLGAYLRFWRLGPVTFIISGSRAKYVIWIIRNQPSRFRLLQLQFHNSCYSNTQWWNYICSCSNLFRSLPTFWSN